MALAAGEEVVNEENDDNQGDEGYEDAVHHAAGLPCLLAVALLFFGFTF